MPATFSHTPLRIAISGGGLAGAALFHALLRHERHLDVHIFEAAPAFKEAGAAVGIARNALRALELLGPSAVACLRRAGAVPQHGAHIRVGQGRDAGRTICELHRAGVHNDDDGHEGRLTSIVQRAAFLRELLAGAPAERMHASKRLVKIVPREGGEGPVVLGFEDCSEHECDVLIGVDGIRSFVRGFVLRGDSAAAPVFAGWWAVQVPVPFAEMEAKLGKAMVDLDEPMEHGWAGDGSFMMHSVLREGSQVQFVAAAKCDEDEAGDAWHRNVGVEDLERVFKGWQPDLFKTLIDLAREQAPLPALYLWDHPNAPTYVDGAVALLGDAAHAMTPWQGSGAGISLEDALILSELLGCAKTPSEARHALRVYDSVRRERTQRIVESSRATGLLLTGRGPGVGLELPKLTEKMTHRWDFILDFDVLEHRDAALRLMEAEGKVDVKD